MPEIIRDGKVEGDNWTILDETADLTGLGNAPALIPLTLWNQHLDRLQDRPHTGIWLASAELPEQIQGDWTRLPVIAVQFPVFADGRGFSIGRLIRERFGYQGELRAIGAPIRDQLSYLARCGFSSFQLADHYDAKEALKSLADFSESYQTAVDQKLPLFRRRQA